MNNQVKEFLSEKIIKRALTEAYQEGYDRANYDNHQAGISNAFTHFNNLFPRDIDTRRFMNIHDCMMFNTEIQQEIKQIIESSFFQN